MSYNGVKELFLYFDVVPKIVYQWFDLWEKGGSLGILHKFGTGRKAKPKDILSKIIEELVKKHSRNLKGVIPELTENYALRISINILQRHMKKVKIHVV